MLTACQNTSKHHKQHQTFNKLVCRQIILRRNQCFSQPRLKPTICASAMVLHRHYSFLEHFSSDHSEKSCRFGKTPAVPLWLMCTNIFSSDVRQLGITSGICCIFWRTHSTYVCIYFCQISGSLPLKHLLQSLAGWPSSNSLIKTTRARAEKKKE